VESSCKLGNEPSGSIKCWELPNACTTCGISSSVQLHRVSYIYIYIHRISVKTGCGISHAVWTQIIMSSSLGGVTHFLFCLLSRYIPGSTKTRVQRTPELLSLVLKGRCETDNPFPTCIQFKETWIYTSTSPYAFRVAT
jgi:hypothetical protein